MKYIFVKWLHDLTDEPIELYSELDDDRNEIRKIEVYKDGSCGYASETQEVKTKLSIEPIPAIAIIAEDDVFEPKEISEDEFNSAWNKYVIEND